MVWRLHPGLETLCRPLVLCRQTSRQSLPARRRCGKGNRLLWVFVRRTVQIENESTPRLGCLLTKSLLLQLSFSIGSEKTFLKVEVVFYTTTVTQELKTVVSKTLKSPSTNSGGGKDVSPGVPTPGHRSTSQRRVAVRSVRDRVTVVLVLPGV